MLIKNNTESIVVKYLSIYLKETFNTSIEVTNRYINSTFNAFDNNELMVCNNFCQFGLVDINNTDNITIFNSLKYYYVYYCAGTYFTNGSPNYAYSNKITNKDLNDKDLSLDTFVNLQLTPKQINDKSIYTMLVANCILNDFKLIVEYKNNETSKVDNIELTISNIETLLEIEDIDINTYTDEELNTLINNVKATLNEKGYYEFNPNIHTITNVSVSYEVSIKYIVNEDGQSVPDIIELNISELSNLVTDSNLDRLVTCFSSTYCRKISDLSSYVALWLDNRYPAIINNTPKDLISSNICAYFVNGNEDYNKDKKPYDIDDIVLSYLLGRTIGPTSDVDDIAYVQKLIMNVYSNYVPKSLGTWDNILSELIYSYQQQINEESMSTDTTDSTLYTSNNKIRLLSTGYFDIYVEKYLLAEQGDDMFNGYSEI